MADFIHWGSGLGSFNRVGLPGHPNVLEQPSSGLFRKLTRRHNALRFSVKAPGRTRGACAVALAPRGPLGLGGGSVRPNATEPVARWRDGKFPQRDGKEMTLASALDQIPSESICQ